jgi:hypothetical protein
MLARVLAMLLVASVVLAFVGDSAAFDNNKKAKAATARGGKGAGAKGHKNDAKKKMDDAAVVHELRHAHQVLTAADPIYNGHRGKAMHEVNAAIGELQREMHARGLKDHAHHNHNVPKNISHAMMATTADALGAVLGHLNGMAKTSHRAKAAGHVKRAISEIHLALTHVGHKHTPKHHTSAKR